MHGRKIARALVAVWALDGAVALCGTTAATARCLSRLSLNRHGHQSFPVLQARKGKGKEIDPFDPEGIDGCVRKGRARIRMFRELFC